MPEWKKNRHPETFPAMFAAAVRESHRNNLALHLGKIYHSEWEANEAMKLFRYWRWTIRNHPAYHLYEVETKFRITAKKICAPSSNGWLIRVEVKPILADLLAPMIAGGE
jgi:hypothetical protein